MPDFKRLSGAEHIQLAAVVVLGVSVFIGWYGTDTGNRASNVNGKTGSVTAWDAHPVLRWVLLAAVLAGFISAWQTLQAHEPSGEWHRGEMSAAVSVIVAALVLVQGWIARPGDPSSTISLKFGWYLAFAAALVAVGTSLIRLAPHAERKPPGV
jgi:cytochrome bd-type quinol oxidase subunit 2